MVPNRILGGFEEDAMWFGLREDGDEFGFGAVITRKMRLEKNLFKL